MTRVLVVDDKEENLYFLQALLEGNGFDVDCARHGEDALTLARATIPDLVVSDLLMPVMDGYTLLRTWKSDLSLNHVPFLVYTATYTQEADQQLALSLGADAFIVKPAEPEELLSQIRNASSGQIPARPAAIVAEESSGGAGFRAYSEVLVRKLEEKMLELDEANRGLKQDIEERIEARNKLEKSASLLRIAGKVARLGGWEVRLPERKVIWSEQVCAIHGVPAGTSPSLDEVAAFCLPEYREQVRRRMESFVSEGLLLDVEFQISTPAGRRSWVRATGEAVRADDGSIVRLQGAIQDISDRKQLEQRLLRAQRMESIATLSGGMAHDLNNVLAPIILSVELLMDQCDDPEVQESLTTIEACAQRGAEMVKQVLSFARGMQGHQIEVDLTQILDDLELVIREMFPSTVQLHREIAEDLWPLTGDPTQFNQVFMNLFLNARDAMPDGGRLSVMAENVHVDEHYAAMCGVGLPGPHVRISVVDTGVGMPPHVVKQVFDPLFTTKEEGKGTGLGLSTVATIVQNHRGSVNVYSEPGEGTTFRFHFPAAVPDRTLEQRLELREGWHGEGELILVVDDEASVRSITQQTLEAFGYRVLTAGDGADALVVYERMKDEVVIVLTDLNMPVMDGSVLIRELHRIHGGVCVIAASGIGADGGVVRAARAGVRHFLTKPYSAEALLTVIREALREDSEAIRGE
jgi:two-component system, cell cycle sensor histidine kinase and response regulator CckA